MTLCVIVRNFPFATCVLSRTGVSDDDFWCAAKTGDRRTGVLLASSQHRCSVDRADPLKE